VITLERESSKEQRAYILPNETIHKDTPLSNFQTTIDKVEKVAGIIFFKNETDGNKTRKIKRKVDQKKVAEFQMIDELCSM